MMFSPEDLKDEEKMRELIIARTFEKMDGSLARERDNINNGEKMLYRIITIESYAGYNYGAFKTVVCSEEFRKLLSYVILPAYREKGWKVEFQKIGSEECISFEIANKDVNVADKPPSREELIDMD